MKRILHQIIRTLDGTPAEYGKRGQGQSLVEVALMLPLLLTLFAAIVEMGWFTNNYLILLEASRVGSREGTKLTGDASPITWERGTVTLRPATDDVPALELPSREGVIPVYSGRDDDANAVSELARGGLHIGELYAARFAAAEDDPLDFDPNSIWATKDEDQARGQCSESRTVGFYTRVACQSWLSMSPLDEDVLVVPINGGANDWHLNRIDDPVNPGVTPDDPPHPSNDIVVSVFSLNLVPAACDGSTDGPCDDPGYRTIADSIERPFRRAADAGDDFRDFAPVMLDGSGNPAGRNADAAQIMVTGRYPANANECADDYRDPFDINDSGRLDPWEIDDQRLNLLNDEDNPNGLFDVPPQDQFTVDFDGDGTNETLSFRGFSFTGKWPVGAAGGCVGSQWSVQRMEELVNLNDANVTVDEMNYLPDRQGLVLVEVFWRHELLLDLPFYDNMFRMLGSSGEAGAAGDTGYINVWAAFPIPTVAFNLDLTQSCDDLLFLNDTARADLTTCPPS